MIVSLDTNAFFRGLDQIVPNIENRLSNRIREVVYYIDRKLHERTPVYTGQAVRNMIWSQGTPTGTALPAIEVPEDTGHTSSMGLGEEPRRPANQQAAQESLNNLRFNDLSKPFVLVNMSPDIGLIEDGSAGLPGRSRAPSGVFAITYNEVIAKLNAGAPLK